MKLKTYILTGVLILPSFEFVSPLHAQAPEVAQPQRMTIPFSDASRPKNLKISMLQGSMTITGYDGNEAVVEYTSRGGPGVPAPTAPRIRASNRTADVPPGMHRIGPSGNGLDATEEGNTIKISSAPFGEVDITVKIPRQTNLDLNTVNGSIVVEGVSGDVELNGMNGSITIRDASGSVVAHTLNGEIKASINRLSADKTSSFSTMNGEIDVTLPADIKARLKMKNDRGDIFTDFDVKMDASSSGASNPNPDPNPGRRRDGGRVRFRPDRTTSGTINGGGPEIQFTAYNGRILIHKK